MIKSVDKLRDYASRNQRVSGWMMALNRIADEIEREIAEAEAFCRRVEEAARNNDELDVFGVAYMPLPVDADGVPIRVGDTVEFGESRNQGIVKALNEHMIIAVHVEDGYMNYAKYGLLWNADECRHVKPRTLEDVLAEFGRESVGASMQQTNALLAKYADEIREMMGGDAE